MSRSNDVVLGILNSKTDFWAISKVSKKMCSSKVRMIIMLTWKTERNSLFPLIPECIRILISCFERIGTTSNESRRYNNKSEMKQKNKNNIIQSNHRSNKNQR